eukprot:3037276-Pleurochrysis_carterae.AAC.1
MVLESPAHLAKVKSEWETIFDQLPPDGDTNQLPESMKLSWEELPRSYESQRPTSTTTGAGCFGLGVTSSLENPP